MKTTDDVDQLIAKRIARSRSSGARVGVNVPNLRMVAGDTITKSGWTSREAVVIREMDTDLPIEVRVGKLAQHWLEVWRAQDAAALAERQRKEQEAYKREMQATWQSCGVGPRFAGCTFENYQPQNAAQQGALAVCENFPFTGAGEDSPKAKGLWLIGPKGTGKTHLATAVLRGEWFGAGQVPGVITHDGLIAEIRATWDKNSRISTEDVLHKYGDEIDVLVLDDVGVGNDSKQSRIDLYPVINRRYSNNLVTIITSNLTASELEQVLGDRITDRLRDGAIVVPVPGESYRKTLEVSP